MFEEFESERRLYTFKYGCTMYLPCALSKQLYFNQPLSLTIKWKDYHNETP